jgi:hypothetical protein
VPIEDQMSEEHHQEFEHRKWTYEIQRRDAERAHDHNNEFMHKANDAAVSTGSMAVRTAVLINGGAAVSVLTFIGGLIGSDKLTDANAIAHLSAPLIWFAWGVVVGASSIGFGYLTNYCNSAIAGSAEKYWEHPYVRDGISTKKWRLMSIAFTVLSIVATVASLVLFICGMFAVQESISIIH